MTRVYNLADLFRKGLGSMRGAKPSSPNVVLVPQLEQAIDTDGCAKDASRYVCGIGWRAGLGVEPNTRVVKPVLSNWYVGTHQPLTASMSMP